MRRLVIRVATLLSTVLVAPCIVESNIARADEPPSVEPTQRAPDPDWESPEGEPRLPPKAATTTPLAPVAPSAPASPNGPPSATPAQGEYELDPEPKVPGRPGLMAGGIVLMVIGPAIGVADGFAIADTASSHLCSSKTDSLGAAVSGIGCAVVVTGEAFLGLISLGATAGGIVMTVLGARPKRVSRPRHTPVADQTFRIQVAPTPTGFVLGGQF
jgi:hypothetical protein